MNIRVVAAVVVLLAACKAAPGATAPKPVVIPRSTTAAPSRELNSPCAEDADCSAIAHATCMGSGLGAGKGAGLCRIVCKGATDERCAAPNACLSRGQVDGAERFSCERTCTGDTDCHAVNHSCQHMPGPSQGSFCVVAKVDK